MTRKEELNAIKNFEKTKGVTKIPEVDPADRLLDREREGREKRSYRSKDTVLPVT